MKIRRSCSHTPMGGGVVVRHPNGWCTCMYVRTVCMCVCMYVCLYVCARENRWKSRVSAVYSTARGRINHQRTTGHVTYSYTLVTLVTTVQHFTRLPIKKPHIST